MLFYRFHKSLFVQLYNIVYFGTTVIFIKNPNPAYPILARSAVTTAK